METDVFSGTLNRRTFNRVDVVEYFDSLNELFEPEKAIFRRLAPTLQDARVLDLGIGGGRTTKYLLETCADYTGVDYVPEFVEKARQKYPTAKLSLGDARDLSEFSDESFDFVLFSYNGLDCISPKDRLRALKEMHRVLTKGGHLMFSSHNRDYEYFQKPPWQRKITFDLSFLKFFVYCLYHLPKHLAMKEHEIHTDSYAIVNDCDHRYSLLVYYITAGKQVEQLNEHGFGDVAIYDKVGRLVTDDTSSPWLYYLATKI